MLYTMYNILQAFLICHLKYVWLYFGTVIHIPKLILQSAFLFSFDKIKITDLPSEKTRRCATNVDNSALVYGFKFPEGTISFWYEEMKLLYFIQSFVNFLIFLSQLFYT